MADCPEFWRNRSIKINLMNLKDEGYLKNLKISAFIALGFDLIVGIGSAVLVWKYSDMRMLYNKCSDELGPWSLPCSGPWPLFGPWSLFGRPVGPFTPWAGFGKFKFLLFTIILGFGMPLIDTCTGKSNHSDPMK